MFIPPGLARGVQMQSGMETQPLPRATAFLTGALALTLLALPTRASAQEAFTPREDIPDAHLRGVTHVVCVTFPEGASPEVPVFERRALGFEPAGTVARARTVPVSRWVDPGGWQEDCFPAFEHERGTHHGAAVRYAHVMLDVRTGRKAWLEEGGADSPTATWVSLESLRALEAFEGKGIEFLQLRPEGSPLSVRKAPRDDAGPVELDFHQGSFILGRRVGDYAEVLDFDDAAGTYQRQGWVRLVDAQGLLLLWPANHPAHGC
jgi:hypothetical protein